jgi:hypothetical protein
LQPPEIPYQWGIGLLVVAKRNEGDLGGRDGAIIPERSKGNNYCFRIESKGLCGKA